MESWKLIAASVTMKRHLISRKVASNGVRKKNMIHQKTWKLNLALKTSVSLCNGFAHAIHHCQCHGSWARIRFGSITPRQTTVEDNYRRGSEPKVNRVLAFELLTVLHKSTTYSHSVDWSLVFVLFLFVKMTVLLCNKRNKNMLVQGQPL